MQFVSIDGTDSKTRHLQYGEYFGTLTFHYLYKRLNDILNVSQIAKFILYADDANIFIIITGENITEVDAQLCDFCKILLKWVDSTAEYIENG